MRNNGKETAKQKKVKQNTRCNTVAQTHLKVTRSKCTHKSNTKKSTISRTSKPNNIKQQKTIEPGRQKMPEYDSRTGTGNGPADRTHALFGDWWLT